MQLKKLTLFLLLILSSGTFAQVPVQITTSFNQDCNNYFDVPHAIVNNKVFYKVNYDLLWVSDATSGGSMLLKNFNMSNWSIGNFIPFNNMLLFTAQLNGDGSNMQLWKSDGTVNGTQQVAVIGQDANNYFDIPYAIVNNKIFLKINYDLLWVTDGTTGGTMQLKNFNMSNWSIGNFIPFNNQLLLTAQLNGDGSNMQLWKSDGTTGGTQQVSVIGQDANNYFDIPYAIVSNKIFLKINYDLLWVTDGTTGGTTQLKNFNMSNWSIGNFIPFNNQLLLTAQLNGDGSNMQLWKSDGTTGGTQQVSVIGQDANNYFEIPYAIVNSKIFMKINYDLLWVTDGTSGGTMLLKNFNMSSWSIGNFIPFNNQLLLTAQLSGDGSNMQLWKSDGTVGGTQQVKIIGQDANNYFDIPYSIVNNKIFLKINYDFLWVTDGTTNGTVQLKNFNMSSWSIGNFITLGSTFLFTAQLNGDGSNMDLWTSDGSTGGTLLVHNLAQDANSYFDIPYTIAEGELYLKIMYDQLWASNGATAGTSKLKDFNMNNWSIGNFVTLDDKLLLTAQLNGDGSAVNLWTVNLPVSSPEIADPFNFVLYPVPAKDYLFVSNGSKIEEYKIFDANGQLIDHGKCNGSIRSRIDFNLPTGIYFLQLQDDERSLMKTFIVGN